MVIREVQYIYFCRVCGKDTDMFCEDHPNVPLEAAEIIDDAVEEFVPSESELN